MDKGWVMSKYSLDPRTTSILPTFRHPKFQIFSCYSATLCGDIKSHPEENKYLKEQKDELKSLKAKLDKVEQDIKNKQQAYHSVQNTFAAQVQSDLINSDHKRYLRSTLQGYSVPNWLLVNSDIRKLERICHGKVPPSAEIPNLLKMYNENFDVLTNSLDLQSCATSKPEHPVKDLWEKKGVKFPGKGTVPNSSWSETSNRFQGTSTQSATNDDPSNGFEGLNLLFEAATLLNK